MDLMSDRQVVGSEQCFLLCEKALTYYDDRLIIHGEGVACIAMEIHKRLPYKLDTKYILLLSLLHDVGAYKTENIDKLVEFESSNVRNHSIYGYLFLKYFTPLKEMSTVVLNHHTSNERYAEEDFPYKDYANLIQIADWIEIAIRGGRKKEEILPLLRSKRYCPIQAEAAQWVLVNTGIYEEIQSGRISEHINDCLLNLPLSTQENVGFLKMLVYSIDFKSEYTVNHSEGVTVVTRYLAEHCGYPKEDMEKLIYASFLHDIGKIAIPVEILEKPGRLDEAEMEIMRGHVEYSEKILSGILDDEVVKMACRHHEKLDGSGYPHHITGEELSLGDRIIAVADIASALMGARSYKNALEKEKTLSIMQDMADSGYIDKELYGILARDYEAVKAKIDEKSEAVRETYRALKEEYREMVENFKKL